jgi:hypothetical protein
LDFVEFFHELLNISGDLNILIFPWLLKRSSFPFSTFGSIEMVLSVLHVLGKCRVEIIFDSIIALLEFIVPNAIVSIL